MRINTYISKLRFYLKEYSRDTKYTDQILAELFMDARAELLGQKKKKMKHISPAYYNTFCIKLVPGLSHECGCITFGCEVLKSEHPLPDFIAGYNNDTLTVFTLGGIKIDPIDENDYLLTQTNDILRNKPLYSIVNNHLIIWNNMDYPAVQVRAIWNNIVDWQYIQFCDQNNAATCIDVFDMEINMDKSQERAAYQMVLQDLRLPLSLVDDMTNDAQPEIKR